MKDTWIWFLPPPENDEISTKEEKIKAIETFLLEEFPGCQDIEESRFYPGGPREGLIVLINRVDGLVSVLYEEKEMGVYRLKEEEEVWARNTSQTKLKFPRRLDIKKYLPRVKGKKLERIRRRYKSISGEILSLLEKEGGIVDYSRAISQLGISRKDFNAHVDHLVSEGKIVRGYASPPGSRNIRELLKIIARPELKEQKIDSTERYDHIGFY